MTLGVDKEIFFSSHELSFVNAFADKEALAAVGYSSTNTLLASLAIVFVLLMTPALGLFYGGLVRRKSTLTIINQCVASLGITTLIWIFGGFSLAFGPSVGKGIIGDPSAYFAFRNLLFADGWQGPVGLVFANFTNGVPLILFFAYQLAFAIITPPLMVGAFADRMKFKNYLIFLVLWQYLIYIPFAHWIWGQGFLAQAGVLDFAGGIVIHVTAGFGALAASVVLGKRYILKTDKNRPHNIPMTIIGATLLFFGWFGFNVGGSAFQKTDAATWTVATSSWINTIIAMGTAMVMWMIFETIFTKKHKPTSVGIVTGAIAGLATITPAAGFVPIWSAPVIGLAASIICYGCARMMHHSKIDDSLEVWAVHGMGGVTGSILIGAFAAKAVNPSIIYSVIDSPRDEYGILFGLQIGAVALAAAYAFAFTALLVLITKPRLSVRQQLGHIDYMLHGEDAYSFDFVLPTEKELAEKMVADNKRWEAVFGVADNIIVLNKQNHVELKHKEERAH
ncbi:ammonium transporter [Ureaplasma miroungigenitalium]|uniref:Ammonium transporter n=1 Tax=Ureaplasma miroungigenitalium TaxID=1042321 RepID=A0ABT3BLY2_9BACT|nr:ammonium transporter [Ureaplasma miroungigenitalium]MCV3728263.1 ammonium transporter [Ureaplasma miroungigenitalium]